MNRATPHANVYHSASDSFASARHRANVFHKIGSETQKEDRIVVLNVVGAVGHQLADERPRLRKAKVAKQLPVLQCFLGQRDGKRAQIDRCLTSIPSLTFSNRIDESGPLAPG